MQYINFVADKDDEEVMHCGPVEEVDAAYLRRAIATLRPLADDDYINGPAIILGTMARFSYVLDGDAVYWCIEWDPGLIIVRFAPQQPLAWTVLRSPVPGFGGRPETDEDWDNYDEDGPNSQYTLVFTPWDAQFDAHDLQAGHFTPAPADVQARFASAMSRANALGDQVIALHEADPTWRDRAQRKLEKLCGKGLQLLQEE